LEQNYPNPFNPGTVMPFELPVSARVRLTVHDLAGRLVRVLMDGEQSAGRASAFWDGRDDAGREVGSGVYFARLDAAGSVKTQRMALLR
jgi:flagellar hook assembly protein FlgD